MLITYYILTGFLCLASLLAFIDRPHWIFRMFEFAKVHLLALQVLVFFYGWFLPELPLTVLIGQVILVALIVVNSSILVKYTPLFTLPPNKPSARHSKSVKLLSANVYQFNEDYQSFIDLVKNVQPDIVVTIESNKDWEEALEILETEYPNHQKIALENTYGLHLYTRLKMHSAKTHYFVADDIPSIEAQLETNDGYKFTFFGVHPPPPSPTEEENSKERDGELMCVAKKVKESNSPTIVVGDFNTVAWSKVSTLFRKTSELIDPRIGRGLISTFHANYPIFRFPIDQMFHSPEIFIKDFKVLEKFGSDHLPLFSRFYVSNGTHYDDEKIETLKEGEMDEVNELIREGKMEDGDRDPVAKE